MTQNVDNIMAAMPTMSEALALLPSPMDSPQARVMLLAIGLQESRLRYRVQIINGGGRGPARGLLQFERGGGCAGVVRHDASRYWMSMVCDARGVDFTPEAIWTEIERDDVLAFAAGRLLLFTDPRRLPAVGDTESAWQLYTRVWRPGKPHPGTWPAFHSQAQRAVAVPGMA